MVSDSLAIDEVEEEVKDDEALPEISIYGQELFRNNILEISNESQVINAPESYILGPGDELIISVWGKSQFEEEHVVSNDGYIRILNGRQRVSVSGRTLREARQKIQKILKSEYSFREGEFDLVVNNSRSVRVSIYGEVMTSPGTVTVSALNSAFNALAAVNGPNDIGSLRKILLQKRSGKTLNMDIYELLNNPSVKDNYYLEDGDHIIIPESENIITLEGAVRRPFKYELLDGEGLKELLEFSGGFAENAFKKKIQVKRFVNDDQKIIDVDWNVYEKSGRNFELLKGDVVYVESIDSEYQNFVEVIGAVKKEGIFERTPNMRVSDLIQKAGLTNASSKETVYLTRKSVNGGLEFEKLNLNNILDNKNTPQNLILRNGDKLEIWALERFMDEAEISVEGAVRFNGKFPYDQSRSIKLRDAIILAGGLRSDASNYAIIHTKDPLNPKKKVYTTIDNLNEVFANPLDENNVTLNAFDSLVVESQNTFLEESYVRIEGAVNKPGEYQYGQGMTIKDLLVLAGGFKIAASTNNIEISRVTIRDNEPTSTIVANLEVDRSFNVLSKGTADGEYLLEPYDNIAIRYIKEFELQKRVFLRGEVNVPGPYAISEENERISSILQRAGGVTNEAFPAGATLNRSEQDIGAIVIKLDEIINNPRSEFNFVVKNGDEIFIPKVTQFVTIRGATKVREVVTEESIDEGNEITVPYHPGKDAMFYINNFAGGLNELADRQKIFVKHANGELKRPRNGFLRKRYPKVYQGSTITVGYKSEEQTEDEKKEDVDWTKVLGDSVGQAMSILTLILLINRLD